MWKAKKITITFDVNGGTEAAPTAIEATAGLVELPKMGGKFSHWNTKADGSGESYQENGIFTANITLYAIYLKAGEYKITYHLDGGVNNPNNPLIYKEGEKYYLEDPTREGYSFVGWKDSKGNITKGISLTPDVIASDLDINNLEFTAVWTLKKYKIIYHSNCDELEDVTVAFAPADGLILADYPFDRDEYTFAGYYANEACTEELSKMLYNGGYILARNATGDIHLYAAWEKNVYVYGLKIKVANLPDKVKALSMWCNINEWKLENIQEKKDLYIAEVKNGTAEFSFDKLNILMPLWCQFVPMTSKDMEMNNSTWWQTALSGSSIFMNAENNLVYDFAENIVADKMILTLDTTKVYSSLEDVFQRRFNTENYRNAFEVNVSTGKYKIIYNDDKSGDVGYQNNSVTSFDATSNVVLTNPKITGYKFLGWYENKTFSGKPITGWAAGEKTADVKLWAKWEKETPEEPEQPQQPEDLNGEGVYSYTVNIADISTAWGGNTTSPTFTIMLMTDDQLAAFVAAGCIDTSLVYDKFQISKYGNMKIADTSMTGDYAVYGATLVNDTFQYYTGVAATITDTTFTVTVDMTKLVKTELTHFGYGDVYTDEIVDLKDYKPYVLALGTQTVDADNYLMTAWYADLMKMTVGATFPANPIKAAPAIPTCKDLTSVVGTMTNWYHTPLTNNAINFTAASGEDAGTDTFAFTNGSWDFNARGVTIDTLNMEYQLVEGADANITFADGVLTAGNEYTATLRVAGAHEAYVKVTEVITGAITAANVESYISGLYEGEHTVAVTGAITSDTISAIKTALRSNSSAKINLDLSQTTGLTEIFNYTFDGCSNLISIIIPDGVTSIGDSAFYDCTGLTNVNIPDSVTSIGKYAFEKCKALTSVTIPNSVTSIGGGAFFGCEALTSLTVTDGNTTYKGYENCIYTKDGKTLVAAAGDLTNITILDGTLSISDSFFANNNNLTNVTIPDSVTSIGDFAFYNCTGLTNVIIPNSVTSIGGGAFFGCEALVADGNTVYKSYENCIYTKDGKTLVAAVGKLLSITIPDGVTSIGRGAFSGCTNLTNVTIPNSVTSIGGSAFYNCTSLTEINYSGSEEQWKAITIGDNNDSLKNATVNYNYTGE